MKAQEPVGTGRSTPVELHLCPTCEAFVRSNWTNCRACGRELSFDASGTLVNIPAASSADAIVTAGKSPAEPINSWGEADEWPSNDAPAAAAEWMPLETSWEVPAVPQATAPAPPQNPAPTFDVPRPPTVDATFETFEVPDSESPTTDLARVETATTSVVPVVPTENSNVEWDPDDDLRPIMLSYNRTGFSGPISHPVPVASSVFTMAPNVLPPSLSKKAIFALSGAGAVVIALALIVVGVRNNSSTSSHGNDKLISAAATKSPAGSSVSTKLNTTVVTAAPEFVTYEAPDSSFSIDFPTLPLILPKNSSVPDKTVYQSVTADKQTTALVTTQTAPTSTSADQVLSAAISGDAIALNAKVTSHSVTTQNARRTISAHMTTDKTSIDAIAFTQNGKLFTLIVQSDNQNGNPTLFGHMSSTFLPNK